MGTPLPGGGYVQRHWAAPGLNESRQAELWMLWPQAGQWLQKGTVAAGRTVAALHWRRVKEKAAGAAAQPGEDREAEAAAAAAAAWQEHKERAIGTNSSKCRMG